MDFSHTRYYHRRINRTLCFLIPKNTKVLYYGKYSRNPIDNLDFSRCVFIDQNADKDTAGPGVKGLDIIHCPYEDYEPDETFDYIVLNGALGETGDICRLLRRVYQASHSSTRVVIYQHNYLWQSVINWAMAAGLKRNDKIQNWLSVRDLASSLGGMGFRQIRTFRQTLLPLRLLFFGPVVNLLSDIIPFFDFLKLDQFIVARTASQEQKDPKKKSCSIILTVRDEKGNIKPIVQSLPRVCENQEILFVEGHSRDGTGEEIERVMKACPEKNIKLIRQEGYGPGDAIRAGFKNAQNEVLILYEGDGTSSPEDIFTFYDIINSGRFDFVEGSRFIYPLDKQCMPFLKRAGNVFFARWFSWFLGQHVTDVLSGIKAFSAKEYELIGKHWGFLGMKDPFGDFEMLYGAFRFGLNFCEIPMHYHARPYGESKTSIFGHGFYLLGMAARGFYLFRRASLKT